MKQQSRTESIKWKSVLCSMPDVETTVLIHMPKGPEPIWLGYYDDGGMVPCWRSVDGSMIGEIVTHWAEMPKGPKP